MIGEIQQQVDFPVRVSPGDPADLPKVLIIEPNEQIIVPIISPGHLPGLPGCIGNMVEIQLLPGPPVGVIADFLPAGSRRSDFISIGTMMLPDQFLHDKFRHGGTADVAMAANMIGVPKAIIVVSLGIMDLVMFNPAITQKKGPYETEEGCLSLTGTRKVTRYREIKVEFQDMKFKSRKRLSKISRQRLSSMNWIIWRRIDLTVLSAVDRYPAKQSQKNLEQARAMGLRD